MYFSVKKDLLLSFEYFISKRILKIEVEGNKVSRPIVRISILSIALAIVVNLITIAVVTGFQHEVRQKVSGFGSHAFIMNAGEGSVYECNPILKNQAFFSGINQMNGVSHVQKIAYKPVLFQSDEKEIKYALSNGKDTSQFQQEILGAIIKGVGEDFDWTFFRDHLKKGKLPIFKPDEISNELLISSRIARDLNYKVGDEIRAFFVKKQPVKRMFKVVGIYETGLEEFDKNDLQFEFKAFTTCGGGGWLAGSFLAKELLAKKTKIFGVEPLQANDASISYRDKKIFRFNDSPPTIADGARALAVSARTFNYLQQLDGFYEVSEEMIPFPIFN